MRDRKVKEQQRMEGAITERAEQKNTRGEKTRERRGMR